MENERSDQGALKPPGSILQRPPVMLARTGGVVGTLPQEAHSQARPLNSIQRPPAINLNRPGSNIQQPMLNNPAHNNIQIPKLNNNTSQQQSQNIRNNQPQTHNIGSNMPHMQPVLNNPHQAQYNGNIQQAVRKNSISQQAIPTDSKIQPPVLKNPNIQPPILSHDNTQRPNFNTGSTQQLNGNIQQQQSRPIIFNQKASESSQQLRPMASQQNISSSTSQQDARPYQQRPTVLQQQPRPTFSQSGTQARPTLDQQPRPGMNQYSLPSVMNQQRPNLNQYQPTASMTQRTINQQIQQQNRPIISHTGDPRNIQDHQNVNQLVRPNINFTQGQAQSDQKIRSTIDLIGNINTAAQPFENISSTLAKPSRRLYPNMPEIGQGMGSQSQAQNHNGSGNTGHTNGGMASHLTYPSNSSSQLSNNNFSSGYLSASNLNESVAQQQQMGNSFERQQMSNPGMQPQMGNPGIQPQMGNPGMQQKMGQMNNNFSSLGFSGQAQSVMMF